MSVVGEQIGTDATAAIKANEGGMAAPTEAAVLLSMQAIGNAVDGNMPPSPVGAFSPQYGSAWTLIDSNAIATSFTPFSAGNYASPPFSTSAAVRGIAHNTVTGGFTVLVAGDYSVNASMYLNNAGLVTISVLVDGVVKYTATANVHGSVDPVERSVTALISIGAGQVVTITLLNGTGVIANAGTSVAITRIG